MRFGIRSNGTGWWGLIRHVFRVAALIASIGVEVDGFAPQAAGWGLRVGPREAESRSRIHGLSLGTRAVGCGWRVRDRPHNGLWPPSPSRRKSRPALLNLKAELLSSAALGLATSLDPTAVVACAASGEMQVLISKILGCGILFGSLFLQLPQLIRIAKSRSVVGLSAAARYSEVPINSSTVIYHLKLSLPFTTYGENVVVLIQNILCVLGIWIYKEPRVHKREMVLWTSAFVLLCAAQWSLPNSWLPLLIYGNIPFALGSTVPQVLDNFKQGHTGQLAITTCFLKMGGCIVRLFTTITQIGLDPALLFSYVVGASMNLILVIQGIFYRKETERVNELEAQRQAAAREA